MSGAGKQALDRNAQQNAPVDIHSRRDMGVSDHDAGHGHYTPELEPLRTWAGPTLKLAAFLCFLWLAIAVAGVYLLGFDRAAVRLDLVEWAAVIAAVCAPLALIGVGAVFVLRLDAVRGATLVGHAQALFDNASSSMHAEIDSLRGALVAMHGEIAARRAEVDQQAQKLLAAGDGFSQQLSQTTGQLSGETTRLLKAAETLDQTAAQAKADMGIVIADLPRVETLAHSVTESIRSLGVEAAGQAGGLEAGLARIAQGSSAAQEAASTATQRLTGQFTQIELAAERANNQIETLSLRLNENVDSALLRTAEAMEATRESVNLQGDALLGTVETARRTLTDIGAEAANRLNDSMERLSRQFGGLEHLISEQDGRVRGMIDQLGSGLAEIETQLAALGSAGAAQTEQLSASVASLRETLDGIAQPLSESDAGTSRLIERIGQMQAMLGEVNELTSGRLPDNLTAASDVVAGTRATLEQTKADIAEVDERLGQLRGTAEDIRNVSHESLGTLDSGVAATANRLSALTTELASSRDQLQAIQSESEDVGFKAAATLIEAIGRAREAAAQAADHVRSVFAGVAEEAQTALSRSNEETLKSSVDEAVTARLTALKTASEEAVAAAQEAAERLARQMLTIAETTASVEARISQVNAQVEEQNQEEFSRRSALLIESLNSTAIDIAKVMSNEVTDTAWAAYLKGDRSVFARRAVRLLDSGEAKAIQRHYEQEPDFRDQVNRYVHDFEAVIRRVLAERDGGPMAVAMLSSDVGKLYVALAQGIERLRTE
jgi:hypothetical protein